MAARKTTRRRSVAILIARRGDGSVVERHEMSLEKYYEDLHEVVDSAAYRAERRIATLDGSLFDDSGELFQEFRIGYAPDGRHARGRTVHADGTVIEN